MKALPFLLVLVMPCLALASDPPRLEVVRNQLGIGTPAKDLTVNREKAYYMNDGMYHVPQYMPGYPTAATLWARTVEVQCRDYKVLDCDGYHWSPDLGRGEYLFVIPKVVKVVPPQIVKETIVEKTIVKEPFTVYVEVPVKKKPQ